MQIPSVPQLTAVQYGGLGVKQAGTGVVAPMVVVAPTAAAVAAATPGQATIGGIAPVAVGTNAVRQMPVAPAAQRQKKRKFGQERTSVPEKVSTAIPESALYNYLVDLDRMVTDIINRRRADFKEPFPPYHEPQKRTLRIAVQATYANQPMPPRAPSAAAGLPSNAAALAAASAAMFSGAAGAAAADPAPEPPSWTLQISGHLTDATDQLVRTALTAAAAAAAAAAARGDPSAATLAIQAQTLAAQHVAAQQAASTAARPNMLTTLLRRVEVHLDPELYPGEAGKVVWDKVKHTGPQREALEVRRIGSRSCKATVLVWPEYQPERYVLPPLLAEVLGMMGHETRSRIMVALYGFIKSRRLQDPKNPIDVKLTPELSQVFGCRTLKISDLGGRLSSVLQPVPPVRVEYDIKLDDLKPPPSGPSTSASVPTLSGFCDLQLLDLDYFTPSPHPHRMADVLQSYYKDKEIEAMDTKLAGLIRRLNECRRRRALLLGFAHSPIDTAYALLAAQARDVRMARQGSGRDYELERRTEVFRQRWVEDAVMNYLHKRMGQPEGALG